MVAVSRSPLLPLLVALPLLCWPQVSEYRRAKQKFDDIGAGQTPRASDVVLTQRELNAYIAGEIPRAVGEGAVKSSHLTLNEGSGVMQARVDFVRLQKNTGHSPGWLLQKMLEGERDIEVTARVKSANRTATIWVDRVQMGGISLPAPLLDFLLEVFIQPQFPGLKLGQPFPLRPGVDHFDVHRGAVRVFLHR